MSKTHDKSRSTFTVPILLASLTALATLAVSVDAQEPTKQAEPAKKTAEPPKPSKQPSKPGEQPTKPGEQPKKQDSQSPADAPPVVNRPVSTKKPKASQNKLKTKKPVRIPTRAEFIEKPGAFRPRMDRFITGLELDYREFQLPKDKEDAFNDMRRGSIQPNRDLIDQMAKYQVYRLTDKDQMDNLSRMVESMLKTIRDAKGANGQPVERFRLIYKNSIIQHCQDLMDARISLITRINALLLLTGIIDDVPNTNSDEMIPTFLKLLKDDKQGLQEDALQYLAMRGLIKAKKHKLLKVRDEQAAVEELVSIVRSRVDVQPELYHQTIETLAALGRAYSGLDPETVDVAVMFAEIALDSEKSLRLRHASAMGLANISTSFVRTWNSELQALVLCKFLRDLGEEYLEGNPDLPIEAFRFWAYQIGRSLEELSGRNQANPWFRGMKDVIGGPLVAILEKSFNNEHLQALDQWIAAQQNVDPKLASKSKQLKLDFKADADQNVGQGEKAGEVK